MNSEQLKKLSQWHVTATLMGVNIDAIYDEYDDYGEKSFSTVLEDIEAYHRMINDPSDTVRAALFTLEQGITANDIYAYKTYLDQVEQDAAQAARESRISNTPAIVALKEKYKFAFITGKQYPKHTHYEFTDKSGLKITGKLFYPIWGVTRSRFTWKDSKGKTVTRSEDFCSGAKQLAYPRSFPTDWVNDYAYYNKSLIHVAHIMAHRVINQTMGKGYVYPKA